MHSVKYIQNINNNNKKITYNRVVNMAEKKHLELTSSHRYTKLTTTYRGTNDEKDLKTRKKKFSTTKVIKKELQ